MSFIFTIYFLFKYFKQFFTCRQFNSWNFQFENILKNNKGDTKQNIIKLDCISFSQ